MQHVGKLKLKDLALEPGEPPSVMRGSDLLREIIQRTGQVAYRFRLWPTFGYEYVSEAVVDLLGYSADEVYADPGLIGRLVYPDDAQLMNSVADAPGDQPLELSLRFLTRDGRAPLLAQRRLELACGRGAQCVDLVYVEHRRSHDQSAS